MPLYDFYCPQCDKTFEELASPGETPPCPHCGAAQAEQRVSAPSPLKSGAFPFKPGPVHPIANRVPGGGCSAGGGCGSGGFT